MKIFFIKPLSVDDKTNCIYITGKGHSGSTLLTLLLARHPEIAAVGELANLSLQCYREDGLTKWAGLCGCGERPFDCVIWGELLKQVHDVFGIDMKKEPFAWSVSDVGLEEEYRGLAPRKIPFIWTRNKFWRAMRYIQYSQLNYNRNIFKYYCPQASWVKNRSFIIENFAKKQTVRAVVDASKDPLGMCDMYYYSSLPVKILFISRDCRGSVWSLAKHAKSDKQRADMVLQGAKDWVTVNNRITNILKIIPSTDWLHIKYEELCSNPQQVMENIFNFVGFTNVPDILNQSDIEEHTIAGNKLRLTGKLTHINEDSAWRKNLTEKELGIITKHTKEFAASLNYVL